MRALLILRVLLIAALVSGAPLAHAEDPVRNIEELDLESLLGTVSAVSRQEESVLTAPAAVTVLDAARIRHSAATTLADLLRVVPGVQVVMVGPGNYLVSIRGTGGIVGNNVIVFVDGIPINTRVDASVDWGLIPVDPQQVERIEVVRGPVSAVYGPNAYTGVINVILKAPSTERAAGAATLAGGVDHRGQPIGLANLTVSGTRGRFSGRLTLRGRFDSLFNGTPAIADALAAGGGTLLLKVNLKPNMTLSLEAGGAYGRRSAVDNLVLESPPHVGTNVFAELRFAWREMPSVFDSLEIWARTRSYNRSSDPTRFTTFNYDRSESGEVDAGFDLRFALPHRIKLAVGGSAGGAGVVAAPFLQPSESGKQRAFYGAYLNGGVDFKRVSLSAAVRVDNTPYSGVQVVYRGAIVVHGATWGLRLSTASSYRDPTFVELAGRFVDRASGLILLEGNPGLRPPTTNSVELGAHVVVARRLTLKPTLFTSQIQNVITSDTSSLVRGSYRNDADSDGRTVLGGEIEAEWRVRRELALDASVTGVFFPRGSSDPVVPEAGDPGHNSSLMAWLGGRSTLLDDRLALSLGIGYAHGRSYNLRAGAPAQLLSVDAPHLVRIEAAADYRVSQRLPLVVGLKLRSHLPNDVVESPLPTSARLGTSVLAFLEYRGH